MASLHAKSHSSVNLLVLNYRIGFLVHQDHQNSQHHLMKSFDYMNSNGFIVLGSHYYILMVSTNSAKADS